MKPIVVIKNNDYTINTEKESYYALLVAIFSETFINADESFEKLLGKHKRSCKNGDKTYLDEDLIDILLNIADELGRSPKFNEVKQSKTIQNRFKSWNNALELAGLETIKRGKYKRNRKR